MTSFEDMTPEEVACLAAALRPHQRYIARLARWMERQGFSRSDPNYY